MTQYDKKVSLALEHRKFIPFFQPLYDNHTGTCTGAEILARLRLSDGTVVLPGAFLPLMGRECELSEMTRTLMAQAGELFSDLVLPDGFVLTVNISADMVGEPWLMEACHLLKASGRGRISLVLELTEHTPLPRDISEWRRKLNRLRGAGIRLALDDFGTGYSGLHLLQQSGAGILKLPGEFVRGLEGCMASTVIIDALVQLANRLGLELIAEGVENEVQKELLALRGIRLMQGWYFSPPLRAEQFCQYMTEKRVLPECHGLTAKMVRGELSYEFLEQCARLHQLSAREKEMMILIARGNCISGIAESSQRSSKTLSAQKRSVFRKMGVKNDASFIHYLYQMRDALN